MFIEIKDIWGLKNLIKHNKKEFFKDIHNVKRYLDGYSVNSITYSSGNLRDQLVWLLELSTDEHLNISGLFNIRNLLELAESIKDTYSELVNKKIDKVLKKC